MLHNSIHGYGVYKREQLLAQALYRPVPAQMFGDLQVDRVCERNGGRIGTLLVA